MKRGRRQKTTLYASKPAGFDTPNAVCKGMTQEQAEFVRALRVDGHCTWREIATACHTSWNGGWYVPSNQLIGMVICRKAATFFGEDYMIEPWN